MSNQTPWKSLKATGHVLAKSRKFKIFLVRESEKRAKLLNSENPYIICID